MLASGVEGGEASRNFGSTSTHKPELRWRLDAPPFPTGFLVAQTSLQQNFSSRVSLNPSTPQRRLSKICLDIVAAFSGGRTGWTGADEPMAPTRARYKRVETLKRSVECLFGIFVQSVLFRRPCPDSVMSATGHPGDGEPRSHRVGYPAAPGAACLNFVDRRTGVILNRLTKTRTRHRDAYGVKSLGDQFPQWEGGAFGILQANRSGRCRRFEPTALRAYCVSRANRQCHVRHHSHYDPLGPRRAVAELCAPEHGRPAGQTAAARAA